MKTNNNNICIEITLPVPKQKVWRFLTQESHIIKWWGDHVSLEARPGGSFREEWFDGEKQVVTSGQIIRFYPPSELKMTWADDDWSGETITAFYLSEIRDGTRLMFEHSGWEMHPAGKRENLIEAHAAGWRRYLEQFVDYATANR